MVGKILDAITEVIDSPEFRELLTRVVLAKYGPELAKAAEEADEESSKDTVVVTLAPTDANLTPEGLAWHFRSKLSRRPNSQEETVSVAAHMQALITRGVMARAILEMLVKRGRSPEPIWKFIERFKDDVVKTDKLAGMVERAQATKQKLEAADGIPVDTRRLSRNDPRFAD